MKLYEQILFNTIIFLTTMLEGITSYDDMIELRKGYSYNDGGWLVSVKRID